MYKGSIRFFAVKTLKITFLSHEIKAFPQSFSLCEYLHVVLFFLKRTYVNLLSNLYIAVVKAIK